MSRFKPSVVYMRFPVPSGRLPIDRPWCFEKYYPNLLQKTVCAQYIQTLGNFWMTLHFQFLMNCEYSIAFHYNWIIDTICSPQNWLSTLIRWNAFCNVVKRSFCLQNSNWNLSLKAIFHIVLRINARLNFKTVSYFIKHIIRYETIWGCIKPISEFWTLLLYAPFRHP